MHLASGSTLRNDGRPKPGMQETDKTQGQAIPYRDLCGKCGARRIDQQIGLEPDPESYVARLVDVFREVKRVLRPDGTCWINIGDTYANFNHAPGGVGMQSREAMNGIKPHSGTIPIGCKPKDLIGIPWMVAFALRADGWWLRSEIIWHKKAPMPESVTDRPTKAHEQVFLLSKAATYYYDAEAIKEPQEGDGRKRGTHSQQYISATDKDGYGKGSFFVKAHEDTGTRNKRSVWTLGPEQFAGAHFATMPTKLVEPCILAGTSAKGCCSKCGSPYERVVEHTPGDAEASERPKKTGGMNSRTSTLSLSGNGSKEWAERGGKTTTTGWAATCTCNAAVTACTVLDCFNGAATVGVVAMKYHRNYIGIDLNAEYLKLSEDRLGRVQPVLMALT